jgi:site-specific DNA-methyltransferase (adenine-specific)
MIEINKIYNEDCITGMQRIPDGLVDVILTDPPYLYLKNQKLDRPFDETAFFNECKRVLKKDGFIVMFGRGTSFYRWNTILANLGFKFKEEIVWDKRMPNSPLRPLMRVHETISICSVGNKPLNRCRIPVFEKYKYDHYKIDRIVERLNTVFGNRESFDLLKKYYESGKIVYKPTRSKFNVTLPPTLNSAQNMTVWFARSLEEGSVETDIISEVRDHYSAIHPTQKPVRLLKRLLALVSEEGNLVLDPFLGSASTAIAAALTERNYLGFEIDKEYYEAAQKRLRETLGLFFDN